MLTRRLAVALVTALLTLSSAAFAEQQRRPELNSRATVSIGADGVPTVSAANARDLYWLMGYVHAGFRLFQMDLTRRQPSGTLAELFGPPALAGDVEARTIGLR